MNPETCAERNKFRMSPNECFSFPSFAAYFLHHLGHCFQCMHIYICLYLYIDPQNQTFQWTKNDNFNPICSMYGIYINKYPKDDAVVYTVLSENRIPHYIHWFLFIKKWPCAWENLNHFQAISTIIWLLVTYIPWYPHHYPTLLLSKYI